MIRKSIRKMLVSVLSLTMVFTGIMPSFAASEGNNETTSKPISEFADGAYVGTVLVDNGESKMFRIDNHVINIKDGKAEGMFTLAGSGFGKIYPGTAEKAEAAPYSDTIGYYIETEGTYKGRFTFTPFPIESFDEELPISGWSIKKDKWYEHKYKVVSSSLKRIGDVKTISPETEAEIWVQQNISYGSIAADNDSIKRTNTPGTDFIVPFADSEGNQITKFNMAKPKNGMSATWAQGNDDLNKVTIRSKSGKIRCTISEQGRTDKDQTVPVELVMKISGGKEVYRGTFNMILEKAPTLYNVDLVVKDKMTNDLIDGCTIKVTNTSGKEFTKNSEGKYPLVAGEKYTATISKEGYVTDITTSYEFVPSNNGEVKTFYMLKEADAKHKVDFNITDKNTEDVIDNYTITVKDNKGNIVEKDSDGKWTMLNGMKYQYSISAEGYVTSEAWTDQIVNDCTLNVPMKREIEEYYVTIKVMAGGADLEKANLNISCFTYDKKGNEVQISQNKDGSYTFPAGVKAGYRITADGYCTEEDTEFIAEGTDKEYSISLLLSKTDKKKFEETLQSVKEKRQEMKKGDKPGEYPEEALAKLDAAIQKAEGILAEGTTDQVYQTEKNALNKALRETYPKQNYCEENITVYAYKDGADKVPSKLTLNVNGETAGRFGYNKVSKVSKKVTVLDAVLAANSSIYTEFKPENPLNKDIFKYEYGVISVLFNKITSYATVSLNGNILDPFMDDIAEKELKSGDVIDLYIADCENGWYKNGKYLHIAEEEKTVKAGEKFTLNLLEDGKKKAQGYEIVLENQDGNQIKAVSDEEGKLCFETDKTGLYKVAGASKEGKHIIFPHTEVNVEKADKPVPAEVPSIGDWKSVNKDLLLTSDKEGNPVYNTGSSKGFSVKVVNAVPEEVKMVKVDGREIDKSAYTIKSGSVVISFNKTFMDSMKPGNHKAEIVILKDGKEYSVFQNFTIANNTKVSADKNSDIVKTGDNADMTLWIAIIALAAVALTAVYRKKLNK